MEQPVDVFREILLSLSYTPCFQIAELFRDDLSRLDAQAVAEPLSQVGVGRACKRVSCFNCMYHHNIAVQQKAKTPAFKQI